MDNLQTAIDEAKDRLRTGKPTLAMHMEFILNRQMLLEAEKASLQQRVEACEVGWKRYLRDIGYRGLYPHEVRLQNAILNSRIENAAAQNNDT